MGTVVSKGGVPHLVWLRIAGCLVGELGTVWTVSRCEHMAGAPRIDDIASYPYVTYETAIIFITHGTGAKVVIVMLSGCVTTSVFTAWPSPRSTAAGAQAFRATLC